LASADEHQLQLLVGWEWRDFFSRSPFRSGFFLILLGLCVAVVLLGLYVLLYYWGSLSPVMAAVFFLYCLQGAVVPMRQLLRAHSRIHEMYLSGRIGDVSPESPLSVALETASAALQTGLFYTLTSVLFLLLVLLHFGVRTH
jgi:hypothetical protein